jgi:phosphate starvation-inducible PhoH-like protein
MGKKKNLQEAISYEELMYIEEKKSGGAKFEYLDAFKNQLKMQTSIKVDIKCKNDKQKQFLKQLKDNTKEIVIGCGSAGRGKSFVSLSYALKALKDSDYEIIVMIIPTAPAGGKDMELGLLKGTMEDKTQPFLEADKDTVKKILKLSGTQDYETIANSLMNSGKIQYEFVNFLLGKTIDNAVILINEAEQYTKENMRLILTRMGENTKVIITGDSRQVNRRDIVNKKSESGLDFVANNLISLDEVAVTEFSEEDIVRNPLITKILKIFDK